MLWTVRYKRLGPVSEATIEAGSEERARAVGERWCQDQAVKFIGIRRYVVADESVLTPGDLVVIELAEFKRKDAEKVAAAAQAPTVPQKKAG